MALSDGGDAGLALGAFGAVQATAAGVAMATGGVVRDVVGGIAMSGALGSALAVPSIGYAAVYQLEIALLFATLVAIGPLARYIAEHKEQKPKPFGLAALPN